MKKMMPVLIVGFVIYLLYIFTGLCFYEDFSEYAIIGSFMYFGILFLNNYCLHWKDNFIAEFIIEKNLNYIFIVLAIFYFIVLIVSFFKSEGLNKIMLGTIWTSIINTCLTNYLYLRIINKK